MTDSLRRLLPPAALAAAVLASAPVAAFDDGKQATLEKLARSTLEELMQVRVMSVAGTPQSRLATPAAVYVITGEDLRRSGHRNIAEALRMIPGMNVARINSGSWLVGARGLSGSALTATRYLVLMDGRMVYDPLLSATQWDTVDTSLEDVDRIEVIRGPGATLWGANAMNGVINIITRPAEESQGTLVQASLGSQDSDATVRHGAALDDRSWYRVFAKFGWHGDSELLGTGASVVDAWSSARLGLRYDLQSDAHTLVSVFADAYDHPRANESVLLPVAGGNNEFERLTVDGEVNGASLMLRVNHGYGEPAGWRLRAYLDQSHRDGTRFAVARHTADLDLRGWRKAGRHDWVWGAEALWTRDRTEGSSAVSFDPASRSWGQANASCRTRSPWWTIAGTRCWAASSPGTTSSVSRRSPTCGCGGRPMRGSRCGRRCRGRCARHRASRKTAAWCWRTWTSGRSMCRCRSPATPACGPSGYWPGNWVTGCSRRNGGCWRWRCSTTTTSD